MVADLDERRAIAEQQLDRDLLPLALALFRVGRPPRRLNASIFRTMRMQSF